MKIIGIRCPKGKVIIKFKPPAVNRARRPEPPVKEKLVGPSIE
jgi:hypothetical protein